MKHTMTQSTRPETISLGPRETTPCAAMIQRMYSLHSLHSARVRTSVALMGKLSNQFPRNTTTVWTMTGKSMNVERVERVGAKYEILRNKDGKGVYASNVEPVRTEGMPPGSRPGEKAWCLAMVCW